MTSIFTTLLNMSITAGYVIIAVVIIRLLMRRLPKIYSYLLWSVVAFRLAVPYSLSSVFSVFSLKPFDMTRAQKISSGMLSFVQEGNTSLNNPYVTTGIPELNSVADNVIYEAPQAVSIFDRLLEICPYIWLAGLTAMLVYGIISCIVLRKRLSYSIKLRDNIYQSEHISSPFILGIVKPHIYIPFNIDEDTFRYVIEHESYHIKRKDNVIKVIAFLLLSVHWFNPLCWLTFYLMSKDMEMSCDEKVLAENKGIKKTYTSALLFFATDKSLPTPSLLYFGEGSVKARIKNVLSYKKPKPIITVTAIILCLIVIVGCSLNPVSEDKKADDTGTQNITVSLGTNLYTGYKTIAESPLLSSFITNGSDIYNQVEIDGDRLTVTDVNGNLIYSGTSKETIKLDKEEQEDGFTLAFGGFFLKDSIDAYFTDPKRTTAKLYYENNKKEIEHIVCYVDEKPVAIGNAMRLFELTPCINNIDSAVTKAVIDINKPNSPADYAVEAHYTLDIQKGNLNGKDEKNYITVYTYPYYADLEYSDGYLKAVSSSFVPTAITFRLNSDNSITFDSFLNDKKSFPKEIIPSFEYDDDFKDYKMELIRSAYANAIQETDYNNDIAKLIDSLDEKRHLNRDVPTPEYEVLERYGEYTMRYIYGEFLKGGQTDDRGDTMSVVMQRMLRGDLIKYAADNGQDYFDTLLRHYSLDFERNNYGDTYIDAMSPYVRLLLEMAEIV